MAEKQDNVKFTHIGVTKETRRKVALLAQAQDVNIYKLVEYLVEKDWQRALKAGMVTEATLVKKAALAGKAA